MNGMFRSVFGRRKGRRIFWLRASRWTGAVAGAVAALLMILPGLSSFPVVADFGDSLVVAGFFLLGWSLLLIWGGRRPEERKGILLLTLCPLLIAWAATEIFAVAFTGRSSMGRLPFWILQGGLSFLFTFSYRQARRAHPKWWSRRA
jgi:lysylphosphatidylglycerol synthetase-like protein (DUF2156 family)